MHSHLFALINCALEAMRCVVMGMLAPHEDCAAEHPIMTLMAPPAPVREISKALADSSSVKRCVTRGLRSTAPEATIARAVGYLDTTRNFST